MLKEALDIEKFLSFFNSIFFLLFLNLLFLASNIPFLLFFFGIGISEAGTYLPLFLLCLVPLGPSLSALFHSMEKWRINKDVYPFREYAKGYRKNFGQAVLASALQMAFAFILITNMKMFGSLFPSFFLNIFYLILFAVMILMTPNIYLLIMKFKMNLRQIFKTALVITISKPLLTLGNAAAFCIVLVFFELVSGTTFLFIGSIYALILMTMNKKLLEELAAKTSRD